MTPRVVRMDAEFVGFGEIVIDGTAYSHDVIIEKGAVRKRRKGPSRSSGIATGTRRYRPPKTSRGRRQRSSLAPAPTAVSR